MLLAINPGWGGQSFVPATHDRVAGVRERIAARGRDILVGVDGGITQQNIAQLAGLGRRSGRHGQRGVRRRMAVNVAEMTARCMREPQG